MNRCDAIQPIVERTRPKMTMRKRISLCSSCAPKCTTWLTTLANGHSISKGHPNPRKAFFNSVTPITSLRSHLCRFPHLADTPLGPEHLITCEQQVLYSLSLSQRYFSILLSSQRRQPLTRQSRQLSGLSI